MIGKIKDKIIFDIIKDQYINKVPYHKLLGLKVSKFDFETAEMTLSWDDKLVGNVVQGSLHGGVKATLLDSIGGLVAIVNFLTR